MGNLKFNSKKINKRKIFGTIVGIAFWTACILFFTYAYYEWKSTNTSVVIGIEDVTMKCLPGTDVNVNNIGPVFDYRDGIKSNFSIQNETDKSMAIDLRLDIESISDSLLTKSFKYMLFTDTTGGTDYDYDNPILMGSFKEFSVGTNIIVTALEVLPSITQSFEFIVFIDGNMKNDINMQENSMVSNLLIGNCEEDSIEMDRMIHQAIYSSTDNSLTFVHTTPIEVGTAYNGKMVDAVYTGFDTSVYSSKESVPWYKDGTFDDIKTVIFESIVSPKSTAYWFYGCANIVSIEISKLNTSNVTSMNNMFNGCSSLESLDLSSFDTNKLTNMGLMFMECRSLEYLDLSNFNTSNVTYMEKLFYNCQKIKSLDLRNFNTSKVYNMANMFGNCNNLSFLDISSFDTSNVKNMGGMFLHVYKLTSLDLSNFNTSKVTDVNYMFWGCYSLTSLNLSSFDTSNITNMAAMLGHLYEIKDLNLSGFDTSKVTNMKLMFSNSKYLNTTLTIRNPNVVYDDMFINAATYSGKIVLNYTSATSSVIDQMIASKPSGANVVKGVLVE